jgi:ubiquinone/menaquinone biosynthesis C-methylase UbiE
MNALTLRAVEETANVYRHIGEAYDQTTAIFNIEVAYPYMIGLLQCRLGITGASILDLGCGSGRLVAMLGGLGARAVGIDISEEAISRGRHAGRSVILGDMTHLPPNIGMHDAVVSYFALNYMPRDGQSRTLAEASRVQNPNGVLVLACAYAESGRRTIHMLGQEITLYTTSPADLHSMLAENGFGDIELRPAPCPPCEHFADTIARTKDKGTQDLLHTFTSNPYALFAIARKK